MFASQLSNVLATQKLVVSTSTSRRTVRFVPIRCQSSVEMNGGSFNAEKLIKQLEQKARKAAARAAERALNSERPISVGLTNFSQHRERMSKWWEDHLAMRASVTEAATGYESLEDEEEEDYSNVPVIQWPHGQRESSICKVRDALREFHYPRSDPKIHNPLI